MMTDKEELVGAITHAMEYELGDAEAFRMLLCDAMELLGMDDYDVSDKLPVNRSTVTRWRCGAAVPLPIMRKPVYRFLLRQLGGAND